MTEPERTPDLMALARAALNDETGNGLREWYDFIRACTPAEIVALGERLAELEQERDEARDAIDGAIDLLDADAPCPVVIRDNEELPCPCYPCRAAAMLRNARAPENWWRGLRARVAAADALIAAADYLNSRVDTADELPASEAYERARARYRASGEVVGDVAQVDAPPNALGVAGSDLAGASRIPGANASPTTPDPAAVDAALDTLIHEAYAECCGQAHLPKESKELATAREALRRLALGEGKP